MAINFPANPSINDTFIVSGTIFTWTGVKWKSTAVTEISSDTSPQLSGDLDLNSRDITGTGDINVTGIITATSFSGDGSNLTNLPFPVYIAANTATTTLRQSDIGSGGTGFYTIGTRTHTVQKSGDLLIEMHYGSFFIDANWTSNRLLSLTPKVYNSSGSLIGNIDYSMGTIQLGSSSTSQTTLLLPTAYVLLTNRTAGEVITLDWRVYFSGWEYSISSPGPYINTNGNSDSQTRFGLVHYLS